MSTSPECDGSFHHRRKDETGGRLDWTKLRAATVRERLASRERERPEGVPPVAHAPGSPEKHLRSLTLPARRRENLLFLFPVLLLGDSPHVEGVSAGGAAEFDGDVGLPAGEVVVVGHDAGAGL